MSERGPSEAWVEAVTAMSRIVNEIPLPKRLIEAESGDWKLALNNTDANLSFREIELSPFELLAESTKYLAFVMLGPSGGAVGGMPEDQFIADMKALAA